MINDATFLFVGAFGSIALFIYLFFTTRHRERIALIEHGKDAGMFAIGNKTNNALKHGMLAIGIGIGPIIASMIGSAIDLPTPILVIAFASIFGGMALIVYYFLMRKKD